VTSSTPSTVLVDAWDDRAASYDNSVLHRDGPSLQRLVTLARPIKPDRCLDIGTGAGHTASRLAQFSDEVIGLNSSREMVLKASQSYGHISGLTFVQANAATTDLPNDYFDVITARHTLHHHQDLDATLKEVLRILRPGGRLVIADEVTPNPSVDDWYDTLQRARDSSHVRAYKLLEWQSILSVIGFSWIVGDQQTCYQIEIDSWLSRSGPKFQDFESVHALFKTADQSTRRTFDIAYQDSVAQSFLMPIALILGTKSTGGGR
jgi:ubiquinone/menaquinone biosynthesis C-methylase UbiE